jgi:hypothetical protein
MAAVGQELLTAFCIDNPETLSQPRLRRRTAEEAAGENERFSVLEKVVGPEVILDASLESPDLQRKALQPLRANRRKSADELDGIDDPQRQRIGLPTSAAARWILRDPLIQQRTAILIRE